jgi:hypothetical protein
MCAKTQTIEIDEATAEALATMTAETLAGAEQ